MHQFKANADSDRYTKQSPEMGQMHQALPGNGKSEKLQYKTDRPIRDHIYGIQPSRRGWFPGLIKEPGQDDHIINQFCLPGWPPKMCPGDFHAIAAAGKEAADPGTHEGKYHGDGEHVEYEGNRALCKLCPQIEGRRHEEDCAKQAHVPETGKT